GRARPPGASRRPNGRPSVRHRRVRAGRRPMTTFYDKHAERQVAAGIARKHEAEAAARQAETELRLLDVAARRESLTDQRERMAAKRLRQARVERVKRWSARWSAVRSAADVVRMRLASAIPVLIGGVAMGTPILIGWNGQLQTAQAV